MTFSPFSVQNSATVYIPTVICLRPTLPPINPGKHALLSLRFPKSQRHELLRGVRPPACCTLPALRRGSCCWSTTAPSTSINGASGAIGRLGRESADRMLAELLTSPAPAAEAAGANRERARPETPLAEGSTVRSAAEDGRVRAQDGIEAGETNANAVSRVSMADTRRPVRCTNASSSASSSAGSRAVRCPGTIASNRRCAREPGSRDPRTPSLPRSAP